MTRALLLMLLLLLVAATLPLTALAAPLEPASDDALPDLDLVRATHDPERDTDALLEVELGAGAGAVLGDEMTTAGQGLVVARMLAGVRATASTWLRLHTGLALPVRVPVDDDDDGDIVGVPRGEHRGEASVGFSAAGTRDGLDLRSEAELHHGGAHGSGVRGADVGPGDFVLGGISAVLVPRFQLFEDSPALLTFPLRYRFDGHAVLEDARATRAAGWARHSGSVGPSFSSFVSVWMPHFSFDLLHFEIGLTTLDTDAVPLPAAPQQVNMIGVRALRFEAVFTPEDDLIIAPRVDLGYSGLDNGLQEAGTFVGEASMRMQTAGGTHMVLGASRRATHSADAGRLVGDTRFLFDLGFGPELLEPFGVSLQSTFSWLDDLAREDGLSDPRFRMALDLELYLEPVEALQIGTYYLVERNLELDAESWDPWLADGRFAHEVAAFVRWRAAVD